MIVEEKRSQTFTYTHIQNGGSDVCIMLSGASYNYDHPLFYYATMTMLKNKIDVIHLHYSYPESILEQSKRKVAEVMYKDIIEVVDLEKSYRDYIFLGKSLGTVPLVLSSLPASTLILLTPLLKDDDIREAITNIETPALAVIGDSDHHFIQQTWDSIPFSKILVPGGNHSLDVGFDEEASLFAIRSTMQEIQNFLTTK
ncbi:alpha/beta hydrolase [Halobacillus salinus]|uniref:Alpha/beta hydrolase n=1 Tax=Halobacillus salinus TaxID=192814 RepID=A0A4Z0GY22_9BACI|nr:alpha/beta hydrolase [Halobacillus salinus]TGB02246.1 alpha/beta hydrolase [Halobacillus salinus]